MRESDAFFTLPLNRRDKRIKRDKALSHLAFANAR